MVPLSNFYLPLLPSPPVFNHFISSMAAASIFKPPKPKSQFYPLLHTLSFSTSPPSDQISTVVSILKQQKSKSRWNYIKTLYPLGFSPTQVSQITLHLRNNPHLALRFFLWSHQKSLSSPNLLSYSTIIHILARSRQKSRALTLIQSAIVHSGPHDLFETLVGTYRLCDSAPFVFDLLIKACLESKNVDSTVLIIRMLRSRGIYPNVATCNLVIKVVSQIRGCKDGLVMFREIFKSDADGDTVRVRIRPNVETFNTVMLCFYRDGVLDQVEEIWREMQGVRCGPNVFSYGVLMAVFCETGQMGEGMELLEEMRGKGIGPDVMVYNMLIRGFCENGEMERAEEVYREMGLSEIEATCFTYEVLVKGYCKIGDVDSAMILFKVMRRKEFQPEAGTVEEVIRELCDKDRIVEGVKFFKGVMKLQGFYPSGLSYEFLIKGLCREGEIEKALHLQTEMVAKGFGPNLEIYNAFVDGYSKVEDYDKVRKLRKEMIEFGLQEEER